VISAAGVDYKYIAYPGAVHSFTSKYADEMGAKFDMPLAYQAEADSASWAEMQALFKSVF
jgi:dienelactone hydrolase